MTYARMRRKNTWGMSGGLDERTRSRAPYMGPIECQDSQVMFSNPYFSNFNNNYGNYSPHIPAMPLPQFQHPYQLHGCYPHHNFNDFELKLKFYLDVAVHRLQMHFDNQFSNLKKELLGLGNNVLRYDVTPYTRAACGVVIPSKQPSRVFFNSKLRKNSDVSSSESCVSRKTQATGNFQNPCLGGNHAGKFKQKLAGFANNKSFKSNPKAVENASKFKWSLHSQLDEVPDTSSVELVETNSDSDLSPSKVKVTRNKNTRFLRDAKHKLANNYFSERMFNFKNKDSSNMPSSVDDNSIINDEKVIQNVIPNVDLSPINAVSDHINDSHVSSELNVSQVNDTKTINNCKKEIKVNENGRAGDSNVTVETDESNNVIEIIGAELQQLKDRHPNFKKFVKGTDDDFYNFTQVIMKESLDKSKHPIALLEACLGGKLLRCFQLLKLEISPNVKPDVWSIVKVLYDVLYLVGDMKTPEAMIKYSKGAGLLDEVLGDLSDLL